MLAPLYGQFTEGFETGDLKEAKAHPQRIVGLNEFRFKLSPALVVSTRANSF